MNERGVTRMRHASIASKDWGRGETEKEDFRRFNTRMQNVRKM